MLKALFIGGTGIISSGITRALAENADWELTILNRGKRAMEVPENVRVWTGDIDNREAVEKLLEGQFFDVVADFIAFTPEQVKGRIKNIAKVNQADARVLMRIYMMERFLERVHTPLTSHLRIS